MFWVFCCTCFARPAQAQRKFYMSSCSHIYCERCVNHSYPYCRRCSISIKVIACDAQMPSEVRGVFCDANAKVSAVIKAMEYQAGQRFGLMSHMRGMDHKYNMAKNYIKDAEIKYSNMKQKLDGSLRRIKELEISNETLKKQCQKLRQTPTPSPPTDSQWFTHLNFTPQSRRSPMDTPSAPFTPRNCYGQYTQRTSPFCSAKTPPLTDSCSSRFGSTRTLAGFTPPQKNLDLLNILNKKRDLNLS